MDWKAQIPTLLLWLALLFTSIKDATASEQRVVCYYTNWSVYRPGTAKFSPQNINPYLCTHLIYAFGGFTKDNTLKPFDKYQDIEKGGYAKFTGLKTYNKNLKTMLAIGGWNEGSSRFSPMVADKQRRKEFVKNSVRFLRQNHFDGLDLDWEYPAFRDGGKPRDRDNYADLVQELREEFDRESSKTGRKRLLLTMAVPAGIEYIDKGYDIPRLNEYLDFINLLSYDYHSAFEPAVNHHAPLYPLEEDNEYNYDRELTIDYTIGHLLESGASPDKIVLGIPTYGRSYTLINEDATDIGAPADGPGEEGDATREKGYLAYYEICENIAKSEEWEVVQPNPSAMGPYAVREKQWVGYDDEDIVRAKARYVLQKKLGGIMFWSIDNDDFRGKCHGRPYPLIEAAKEALLAGTQRANSGEKRRLPDSRKKNNTIGRKIVAGNRRTTTTQAPPASRRRVTSSRSNARTNARANANVQPDDEEDEDNVVKAVERPNTRTRSKTLSKNRVAGTGRRKQQHNSRDSEKDKEAEATNDQPLSNSFTTPEPPTTPDPGSDFKCEDEGFFPHPRDCKKYFWCLDSGPGGLGVVAHAFTCPSGLVFNKAADSCDYPRNVVCPKKGSPTTTTTTTEAATRSTTRKPARGTTTTSTASTPESEEYEYYDDEETEESQEDVSTTTTTLKPLRYKTISRSKPAATTTLPPSTTTTEAAIVKTVDDVAESFEDEEDPRVLKELIDLIKKAGGIEQLEKQLHYQEKNSGNKGGEKNEKNENSTPAAISRSLYERVLSRQAARTFLGTLSTNRATNASEPRQKATKNTRSGSVNGPGGSQFEGLDELDEVKSLRRTNKPKYTTIQRHRTSTSESSAEKADANNDEEQDTEEDADNADVASTEDRAVSNPPRRTDTERRVTQSYVNIRRSRLPSTKTENDVQGKDEDLSEEDSNEDVTLPHRTVKPQQEVNSRYTNIHRFRSTTSRNNEVDQTDDVSEQNDIPSESTTTTTTTTTTEVVVPVTEEITETPVLLATTLQPSTTVEPLGTSTEKESSSSTEPWTVSSSIDSTLKLVDESATEILLTTAAALSSSTGSSPEPFTRGSSNAVVSQPRPFAYPRNRGRITTPAHGSTAPVTEQSRLKVDSESVRLPTLKELVGYSTVPTDLTSTFLPSTMPFVDITFDDKAPRNEQVNRTVSTHRLHYFNTDNLINQDAVDSDIRELHLSRDKEILDNDVLGSVEQQRIFPSSAAAETHRTRSKNRPVNDTSQSINRVEVPVKILNDEGESLAELILIRIPANKLDSAILKPVFTVKLVEPNDERQDGPIRNSGESLIPAESSLENDLYPNRRGSTRRRRVRIKQTGKRLLPDDDTPAKTSEKPTEEKNRSRVRQRIVKARRKTRVKEIPLVEHSKDDGNLKPPENKESVKIVERIPDNVDNVVNELKNETSVPEIPAEVKITTIRGNLPTSLKPSNITHGFYITRSSDEDSKTTTITEGPSINSTGEVMDTPIQDHENRMTYSRRIFTTTKESSTDQTVGTTIEKMSITTTIPSETVSSEIRSTATMDTFETVTSNYLAPIVGDEPTESSTATVVTSPDEKRALEITTFRPIATATGKPADYSTTRYSTDSTAATTETIDNYTATNLEDSTTGTQFVETERPDNRSFSPEFRNDQETTKDAGIHVKRIDVTQPYDKASVKPLDTTTEFLDTTQNSVETTVTLYTLKSSPQRRTISFDTPTADDVESDSTWVSYGSTEAYDNMMKSTITSTEGSLGTNIVEIDDGNSKTLATSTGYGDDRTTTISWETEDNSTEIAAVTSPSASPTEQAYDKNPQSMTSSTVAAEETTRTITLNFKRADGTTKSVESDSSATFRTTTPDELLTTTEAYEAILFNNRTTDHNYQSTNFDGVMSTRPYGTTLESADNVATTETTDSEITNSVETVTTTVKTVPTRKQVVDPIKSTDNGGSTVEPAPTTRSWLYNRPRNSTQNSEYDKSETTDIPTDTTLPSRNPSPTEAADINPTTETFGATGRKISEEEIRGEAIDPVIREETAMPKSERSSTMTPADAIDEIIQSTTTVSDDKDYSVSPVMPKRTRGRIRFNNSAGSADNVDRNKKPAKQLVVVRRRITRPSSNNRKLINDPTENNTTNSERGELIDEKMQTKEGADEKLAEGRSNSTKSAGRRVVVYRARSRAETTTATTMTTMTTVQSFSVSKNDTVGNSGRVRRGKWKKRLVPKTRARSDDDESDDQTIAETGDFRRAIIADSIYEEHLTKMIGQDLVSSVEQKDEDVATAHGEGNIYKGFGGFPPRTGSLVRPGRLNISRTSNVESLLSTSRAPFSKIRPNDSGDDTTLNDQSGRAQQLDVTLADPPEIRLTATTAGRLPLRTASRKISTTMTPRRDEEAPTTWRTTPISRGQRHRDKGTDANSKAIENKRVSMRPRRPAIVDYDYYVDDDQVRLVLKPELKDKLYVTRQGGIRCLDQGNFAHPTSCKKFITCARMGNGQVLSTEYTCPDKLSFDPVGGICNWSAGLGCEEKPTTAAPPP